MLEAELIIFDSRHTSLCFAEDSETLVIVAASTMTDMFGATFGPYYYEEM